MFIEYEYIWIDAQVNREFRTATTVRRRNILSTLQVIERKENSSVVLPKKKRLHNIQTNEVMTEEISSHLLNVDGIWLTAYENGSTQSQFDSRTQVIILIIVVSVHRFGDSRNVLKEVSKRQDV